MSELLQANIFFLIASLATVVFCILVSFILYQVFKIMQSIRAIISRIENQSEQIASDIDAVRTSIHQSFFVSTFLDFLTGQKKRSKRKSPVNDYQEEENK